jgi:Na+/proline symporter
VPIYLTYAATLVDPVMTTALLADDAQLVLPTFVKAHLPLYAQIIFYGALLSVIMSTASGTLLAPSVTISENIIKEFMPHHRMSQKRLLWITRSVVVAFTVLVVFYSLWSLRSETSIHQMVENAYKVTLAAFVLLRLGCTGSATIWGRVFPSWGCLYGCDELWFRKALPPQFAGLGSTFGMVAGRIGRQTTKPNIEIIYC